MLAKFFFCVFIINTQKKERGQYPAILTEQAWSIKDLLYEIKHQKIIFDVGGVSNFQIFKILGGSLTTNLDTAGQPFT